MCTERSRVTLAGFKSHVHILYDLVGAVLVSAAVAMCFSSVGCKGDSKIN